MKNNSSKLHSFARTVYIVLTVVFVAVAFGLTSSDKLNLAVNVVCVVIMFAVAAIDYNYCLKRTNKIADDFDSIKTKIKSGEITKSSVLKNEINFSDIDVQNAFEEYKNELKRISSDDKICISPDIRDYINDDLIDTIVKKEVSDQVSGAMTGMGILGTFVGLVIGLNSFNLGTDIDTNEMQNSISNLLEGIKTAFITSIYGVVYSLVFNYFYKKIYIITIDSMNEFISCFEESVVPSPENDLLTVLVRNQEEQTRTMQNFASDVAEAMSSQLNNVLDKLNTSIDSFVKNAGESNAQAMQNLVHYFTDAMNNSMGNQLDDLGKTISELNDVQKKNTEEIHSVVNEICNSAADIIKVNESLENSVTTMDSFMSNMNAYQQRIDSANEALIHKVEVISGFSEKQGTILEEINASQKNLNNLISGANETMAESNKIYSKFSSDMAEAFAALSDNITTANNNNKNFISEAVNSINEKLDEFREVNTDECNAFIDVLRDIVSSSHIAIEASAEKSSRIITESFENVEELLEGMKRISSEQNEDILKNAQLVTEQSKLAIEECRNAMREQSEITREELKTIAEATRMAVSEMDSYSQNQISRLDATTTAINNKIDSATNKLIKDVEHFGDELGKSLEATWGSFDDEAAKIVSHLSGTIMEISEHTTNLTRAIEDTPSQIMGFIDDLTEQLTEKITEINNAQVNEEMIETTANYASLH